MQKSIPETKKDTHSGGSHNDHIRICKRLHASFQLTHGFQAVSGRILQQEVAKKSVFSIGHLRNCFTVSHHKKKINSQWNRDMN